MAQVSFENVSKVYPNGYKAVQPASFEIPDGELVVLVGPSGCGKSTLLRMVAGLEEISDGTLYIGERVVNDVDPADRNIAMVFQNYALYPHMSVAKNMGYGLKNRGLPKEEIARKVEDAAKMLNLTEYLERRPSQLSGGQRQRVAMGRAIVRQPELFLFDEPLSNLDAKLRNQMRVEIRALQRRLGTTAIYVTHDQVEAMTMADRIIVLNGGVIEQIGTPAEIYAQPASTFVAGFMGAPPMNLMEGKLNGQGVATLSGGVEVSVTASSSDTSDVLVGIRPEDVEIEPAGPIPFQIDLIEELGANRLCHGIVSGQPFTVSVAKDVDVVAGPAQVRFKSGSIACFEAEGGKRI